MLCSSCSKVVKPVVICDIDGTLGDYHKHFCRFAVGWLGRGHWSRGSSHAPHYVGQTDFKIWFCDAFGVDVTTYRAIKLAYRQGGMKRTMPVFEGAAELTARCRAAGAEVWLATTRPHDRFDRVDPDTREWLDRNGIRFDALRFGKDKIEDIGRDIDGRRVVAVIDDLTEVLASAKVVFPQAERVLRRSTFNQRVEGDWTEALYDLAIVGDVLTTLINDWKANNE